MDETSGDFRGLGPAFFRPFYGATAPIPAGWEDSGWCKFVDPIAGSECVVMDARAAAADIDRVLEKKRARLPPGTVTTSYAHPTFVVQGLSIAPDPSAGPDALHIILIAGPFGIRQLMITGPLGQADVQAFVLGVAPETPASTGWVARGLSLPLPERAIPPPTFEYRSRDAVLSIEWTADAALPPPDLQAFIDESEVLSAAGPEHYDVSETSLVLERRLVPARLGLGADCFVAQAQLVPTRLPAPWRMRAPSLRLGLSGKTRAGGLPGSGLEALWSNLLANVAFLDRDDDA